MLLTFLHSLRIFLHVFGNCYKYMSFGGSNFVLWEDSEILTLAIDRISFVIIVIIMMVILLIIIVVVLCCLPVFEVFRHLA